MKKIFLILIAFIVLVAVAMQFIAVPKAKKDITTYLASVGFKNTKINGASLSMDGLHIKKAILDKDKFNVANDITAKIFWPSYLFNSNIKSITVDTLKISSVANTPKDIIRYKYFFNAEKIKDLATQNIKINKIIWDIATPKNVLRIEGDLNLKQEGDAKKITANLNAAQHEFTLNSQWSGTITNDNSFNIEALYDGLGIDTKNINLNRATGWISLKKQGEESNIALQLDAGSGGLFNVPVKNISLILNQDDSGYPVLLRANVGGIEGVNLYGDFKFSNDIENQAFELLLDMKDPSQFIHYLTQRNILKNTKDGNKYTTEETGLYLTYEPKNRFADGPFPFTLGAKNKNKNTLKGTVLIYPNNLDIRGNAQGNKNIISLLQALFFVDDKNISEGHIRLDKNIKNLL